MGVAAQTSRARATIAGALTGLVLAAGGFLGMMAIQEASNHNAVANEVPVWARIFVFAPGVIGAGMVFAFPIAMAMVFTIVALARRFVVFDSLFAWGLAGVLFTSPAAWLFSGMLENGRIGVVSVWSYGLMVGAISGIVARRFRLVRGDQTV